MSWPKSSTSMPAVPVPADDDGLPLSCGRTIALFGREWRVQTAEPVTTYTELPARAVPTDSAVGQIPSDRAYQGALRGSQPDAVEQDGSSARGPAAPGWDRARP